MIQKELQHTYGCELISGIHPGGGCICGANEKIKKALKENKIKQSQVVEDDDYDPDEDQY